MQTATDPRVGTPGWAPHTDADLVVAVTMQGEVLSASSTVETVLGWDLDALRRDGISACAPSHDLPVLRAFGERLGREGSLRTTIRLAGVGGATVWLDVAGKLFAPASAVPYAYLSARDVTDDVLAMQHLAASEHQWRLAFEHSPIGGALVATDGGFLLANDALAAMLGYRPDELTRSNLRSVTAAEDWPAQWMHWQELLEGRRSTYAADHRYVTAAGGLLWCHVTAAPVVGDEGDLHAVMIQLQDITERRDAELALASQALHDALTGLPNRFMTRQWLSSALADHPGQPVGVLYCDLDRFKLVNDSLGHAVGDDLLVEVAARLREALRDDDLVGRVGGDEFIVVAEGLAGADDLMRLAHRLVGALAEPVRLGGHPHTVTLSIGAAIGRDPETAEELLVRADMALLRAKRLGRARVELFDVEHDRVATRDDLELEDHLRESVEAGELRAYYQPIVSLAEETLVGYESLLRWQHPARGLLAPEVFLDLAESSGLISSIGWWMLSTVCEDASGTGGRLCADGTWISVNASPSQLSRKGVAGLVRRTLEESGLPPELLHLEITETALIQASGTLVSELREISGLGVRIVLDDFGTGYSSLSLLRDFPVDMVKIDRSFVQPLLSDSSALAIVRAVLSMCHDLGLPTVAEGVETSAQADRLRELGCSHAQGFLYGHPEPLRKERS